MKGSWAIAITATALDPDGDPLDFFNSPPLLWITQASGSSDFYIEPEPFDMGGPCVVVDVAYCFEAPDVVLPWVGWKLGEA